MTKDAEGKNGKVKIIYVLLAVLQAITMFGISTSYSEFKTMKEHDAEQSTKIEVLETKLTNIEASLKEIKMDVKELVKR